MVIQESGEHVLITAGEIHLQRCLQDLRESYAKIEINASQPIVPFRETVVFSLEDSSNLCGHVQVQTTNKNFSVRIQAVSLPEEVTALLEKNVDLIKAMRQSTVPSSLESTMAELQLEESISSQMKAKVLQFKNDLARTLQSAGTQWQHLAERIVCFGPRRFGPNVLINRSSLSFPNQWGNSMRTEGSVEGVAYLRSFINRFDLATQAGPLCEEPMVRIYRKLVAFATKSTQSICRFRRWASVSSLKNVLSRTLTTATVEANQTKPFWDKFCPSSRKDVDRLSRIDPSV